MIPLIPKKTLSKNKFCHYLKKAQSSGQWSNGGWAVNELEIRARDLLEIDNSKAIIATSSGTSALHSILWGIFRQKGRDLRVGTQDFTFPSNSLGPAQGPLVCDFTPELSLNLDDEYIVNSCELFIATNCFGHLLDIDEVINKTEKRNKILIFDNAATPYTFYKGKNSLNYGTGSYISLHTTKLLGFGEGGLAIVDKEYEEQVRTACNFGLIDGVFNERSGNFKMSEVSAAGILQYWDQFNFESLRTLIVNNYYNMRYLFKDEIGSFWPNLGDKDDKFLPAWLPFIYDDPLKSNHSTFKDVSCKKYYKPLRGFSISSQIYDRIMCYSLAKDWETCLIK